MSLVKLSDRLAKFLLVLAALWAFGLCFVIMADIVGRGAFNHPVNGVREIVMNSIVIIVFLQAGFAIRSGSMLKADFLLMRFNPTMRRVSMAFCYLLGAVFFFVIAQGAIEDAIRAFVVNEYEGEGALRVPVWPTRWMLVIGGFFAALNYLIMFYLDVFKPEQLATEADDSADTHV